MRVLISPLAELRRLEPALVVAERLAGPGGVVVSLPRVGVSELSRSLSEAEVERLRGAMLGAPGEDLPGARVGRESVVGYVCAGSLLSESVARSEQASSALVAVTDHADLTWRSPLTGPNDDDVGPRFPSVTGVYVPEFVMAGSASGEGSSPGVAGEGMIVAPGIVAGVQDGRHLSDHEQKMAAILDCAAASSELAPVAIVAAHLGLRVAAAVLTLCDGREMPGGGS